MVRGTSVHMRLGDARSVRKAHVTWSLPGDRESQEGCVAEDERQACMPSLIAPGDAIAV